jgi:UDP-N-acetylmuramate-alanine ligase
LIDRQLSIQLHDFMHIHILGICGTFMGGIAALARAAGHRVTGSDQNVYPPMSDQLQAMGIELIEGYDPAQLALDPDEVVVGNVMSRGNALIEALLDSGKPYTSGPEWLARNVLAGRWTLAVAGTHGKTTTSSILAWILQHAGLEPGFLIGGVPVYDDFAHHPTAIETTIDGLRRKVGSARLIAVLEPRSNTMKLGTHRDALANSLSRADEVWMYHDPSVTWDVAGAVASLGGRAHVARAIDALVDELASRAQAGDHILIMSNGGFGGIHTKLLARLRDTA